MLDWHVDAGVFEFLWICGLCGVCGIVADDCDDDTDFDAFEISILIFDGKPRSIGGNTTSDHYTECVLIGAGPITTPDTGPEFIDVISRAIIPETHNIIMVDDFGISGTVGTEGFGEGVYITTDSVISVGENGVTGNGAVGDAPGNGEVVLVACCPYVGVAL